MNIIYNQDIAAITLNQLEGFFVGWKNRPDEATLKQLLDKSDEVIVAVDSHSNKVVGFISAITDGVLSAYIPFLEVLPEYQKKGIGVELVQRMLKTLESLYMVDIVCDEELVPFYEKMGLKRHTAMIRRNFEHQSGEKL